MGGQAAAKLRSMPARQLAVLRLQLAVARAQEQQAGLIDSEHAARATRLSALARRAASVCAAAASGDSTAPANIREYEKAFDAVLAYVLEASGLVGASGGAAGTKSSTTAAKAPINSSIVPSNSSSSNCTDAVLRAEASAALDSVFPLSSVARWVTLPPAERLAQLQPLAKLTLGICLFNHQAAGADGANHNSSSSGVLAPGAVLQQLQQGSRLLHTMANAEAAAWAALWRVNRPASQALDADQRAMAVALLHAQVATSLRLMVADATQGLAACEEMEGALRQELEVVSLDGRVAGPSVCFAALL